MIKKIIFGITAAISVFSTMVIVGIGEVDNWWELSKPWFIVFLISSAIGVISYNITEIRRYTYPAFVCLLAWLNEHKLLSTNFARQSNYIYRKNNRSYSRLFEITQYLYDRVMFADI